MDESFIKDEDIIGKELDQRELENQKDLPFKTPIVEKSNLWQRPRTVQQIENLREAGVQIPHRVGEVVTRSANFSPLKMWKLTQQQSPVRNSNKLIPLKQLSFLNNSDQK